VRFRAPFLFYAGIARTMRERMQQEFARVFRPLGLLYPARGVHNAYFAETSEQAVLY
jgi:hypothetical protein